MKSAIEKKNRSNFKSFIIGDSNGKNNSPHKLSLTNIQVLRLCKAFANKFSANIKLSKGQLHERGQSEGFFGTRLRLSLKPALLLMGKVLNPLAKVILMPFSLTVGASATEAAIHKKIFMSDFTTLLVSNEEIEGIVKIVFWRILILVY